MNLNTRILSFYKVIAQNIMAEFKILKTWELETSINQILHQQAANYYSRLNIGFMLPIIVCSSALGTMSFVSTGGATGSSSGLAIHIMMGCFGYISAILTTTHNFLNIQKLQATHALHAVEYSKISRDIKMHIYLSETNVKVYANIAEYIKQCRTKIDKLIESADDIPDHIEKKVAKRIDGVRANESKEINELIRLSQKNVQEMRDEKKSLDVNDMTDLSEILVVKQRRKSRDAKRVENTTQSAGESTTSSNRNSNESQDSKKSVSSGRSGMSSGGTDDSCISDMKIQERLSLDTFFKSVKEKSARDSWKKNLLLLDEEV